MQLHNRINKKELKEKVKYSSEERTTLSFYRYARIDDPETFRDQLYQDLDNLSVLGRIYLANEGINAQLSVPTEHMDRFRNYLYDIPGMDGIRLNTAIDDDGKSFFKLTIKVKDKIVADGLEGFSLSPKNGGFHISAEEFNQLAEDPNTVVVDMRNHYETEVGHFENAYLPDADTFRDALPRVKEELKGREDKNIVMYCTGGIRCEKASAYLKQQGYKNVFQLDGGIIEYAREVQQKGLDNKFRGKNFVFDERLGERISDEVISHCHQCGKPSDRHINCKNDACHLLFIQCEECAEKYEGCCSTECQDFIHLPEEEQKRLRAGKNFGQQIFRKGRFVRREDGSLEKVKE